MYSTILSPLLWDENSQREVYTAADIDEKTPGARIQQVMTSKSHNTYHTVAFDDEGKCPHRQPPWRKARIQSLASAPHIPHTSTGYVF
jgi:hypothetical protein